MSDNSPNNSKPAWEGDLSLDFVDAVSEVCNQKSSEEEFHDAPEMKEVGQATMAERKLQAPSVNLQELASSLNVAEESSSKLPRPERLYSRKHQKLKDDLTGLKIKTDSLEEGDCSVIEEQPGISVRQVSRDNLSEKASLGHNLSGQPPRRPSTLTAARLEEIASGNFAFGPTNKESSAQKRPTTCPETIALKKPKQVTFDFSKIDEIKIGTASSERRPNSSIVKKPRNPETEKNRDEEIEKIKQRIAATRLNLCSEKSISSLNQKKGKHSKPHNSQNTVPARSPDHVKKSTRSTTSTKADSEKSDKLLLKNYHLRNNELDFSEDGNINSVEISLVEVRKDISPMDSTHAANIEEALKSRITSASDVAINTEQTEEDEEVIALRKEKENYLLSNMCLQKDNDNLKEIITKQQKKECDLRKEMSTVSEALMRANHSLKDMEKRNLEKDNTIAQLRCHVNKLHDVTEKLKEKECLITELENRNSGLKDENIKMKKELERNSVEQQSLNKDKKSLKNLICQLREERDSLETKISDLSDKILEKERELTKALDLLADERKQHAALKEKQDETSSASIVNLSEQLLEKDSIICELEKLRSGVQLINKEVCGMLASVFNEFGLQESETDIESLISSGRTLTVKDNLISLIEKNGRKELETCHEECRKVIFNLEDRAAVLEAELEESKNYSENLAGVISTGKIWDMGHEGQAGGIEIEQIGCRSKNMNSGGTEEAVIGDTRNMSRSLARGHLPQNLYDMFVLLEGKRQALMKMERKVQELEDVHSKCNQKRVRNEMRISQLELALAAVKLNHL